MYENQMETLNTPEDDSSKKEKILAYKKQKEEFETELKDFNRKILIQEQNIKSKDRIAELMEEEKTLAEQIAELEGQEFACEEFVRTKVEMLESKINSKFKLIKFKLFNTLVNGALEECCESLIDGVPFQDANTASKVNAGIDIINTLSEHFKIQAPIFIDNRESVNNLIDCNSQIVNLIVSKDNQLKVEVA